MKLEIKTIFKKDINTVWRYLMMPKTLEFIAKPLVFFVPKSPKQFPTNWELGSYHTQLKIFGFIPFGSHTIVIEVPKNGENRKVLVDNGYGKIVKRWYHVITIENTGTQTTQYTDSVEVEAGLLTPFIFLFAYCFYHWRQRQWQVLIKNDFQNLK